MAGLEATVKTSSSGLEIIRGGREPRVKAGLVLRVLAFLIGLGDGVFSESLARITSFLLAFGLVATSVETLTGLTTFLYLAFSSPISFLTTSSSAGYIFKPKILGFWATML